jgi:hypothetical protein
MITTISLPDLSFLFKKKKIGETLHKLKFRRHIVNYLYLNGINISPKIILLALQMLEKLHLHFYYIRFIIIFSILVILKYNDVNLIC